MGKSLIERVGRIEEKVQDKKKPKFNLPLSVLMQQGKVRRNYAIVCIIGTNGSVNFKMLPIEDDTIKVKDTIYSASSKDILRYKKKPLLIITEWNMQPFSPSENFEEASKNGTLTSAEKLILTKMRLEAFKPKMQLNIKVILIILIVAGVGLWLLSEAGLF